MAIITAISALRCYEPQILMAPMMISVVATMMDVREQYTPPPRWTRLVFANRSHSPVCQDTNAT
jgi:hypothetical protein